MTQRSRLWNGSTTGDATEAPYDAPTEFAQVLMSIAGAAGITTYLSGVFRSELNQLAGTGAATPVSINTGRALVYGTWYENDVAATVAIPTPAAATRVDRIVLRKDWLNQTVRITRIAGVEGGGVPAMTQVAGTTWDMPIIQASITTGGVITITDERNFIGGSGIATPSGTNSILTSTGGVAAWSTTPTIGGALTVSFANAHGGVIINSTTGTNAASIRFTNTGGSGYVGLDNSTASIFGGSAYGLSLFAPAGSSIELMPAASASVRLTIAASLITARTTISITSADTYGLIISSAVGTASATARFFNTSGSGYVGLDNSAGSFLGASAYSLGMLAPASSNIELIPGATVGNRTTVASTGAVTVRNTFTVSTGGAAITGNSTVTGTLTSTSTLTVNAGGLRVTAGNIGVGIAPAANIGIQLNGAILSGSANQYAVSVNPVANRNATASYDVYYAGIVTETFSSYTVGTADCFFADSPIIGTGSTVTNIYGFRVNNQGVSGKTTNAYGIYVNAQSNASTANIGIYNGGTLQQIGNVGIGAAPVSNMALCVANAVTSDGSIGGYSMTNRGGSVTAAVNADSLFGLSVQHAFALASKTGVTCYGISISPTWAAANINYGLLVSAVTSGTTNYGIYITAPSGGTTNIGLYNVGSTVLAGNISFFTVSTPVAQQTITGSRGGNAALADLLSKLATYGLIVNSTTA